MATRKQVTLPAALNAKKEVAEAASSYFASGAEKDNIEFVSSGCQVMDEALGGGYALGRVANIVGDRSSGKTLKAMEAIANFFRKYPDGWCRYAESEAAFDREYAAALGIPVERIIFNDNADLASIPVRKRAKKALERDEGLPPPMENVEDWHADLEYHLDKYEGTNKPGLYILDSLDALSDDAEEEREFNEGTYGGTKPKKIGELFRRTVTRMEKERVLLIVISQLRDKIGVTFGETKTRSGGKALDFYCTHIVWLAEIEKLKRTVGGVERVIGVQVEAYVKKNKVGLPFRRARYPILFGYGIDDLTAAVEFLLKEGREKRLADVGLSKAGYKTYLQKLRDTGGPEVHELRAKLNAIVRAEWRTIETSFLPKSTKY